MRQLSAVRGGRVWRRTVELHRLTWYERDRFG